MLCYTCGQARLCELQQLALLDVSQEVCLCVSSPVRQPGSLLFCFSLRTHVVMHPKPSMHMLSGSATAGDKAYYAL
jgi:hypothetical protein